MESEETGFIRAVVEDPEDDTVRLVYADWLEERDAACDKCGGTGANWYDECKFCEGTGRTTQYRDRAAFIRLQVERAAVVKHGDSAFAFDHSVCNKPGCVRCRLGKQANALYDKADPERWLGELPGLERHTVHSSAERRGTRLGWVRRRKHSLQLIRTRFHRGFVNGVICHPAEWIAYEHLMVWNAEHLILCWRCRNKKPWYDALGRNGVCIGCEGQGVVEGAVGPATMPVKHVRLMSYPTLEDLAVAARYYPLRTGSPTFDRDAPEWSPDRWIAFTSVWPWIKFQVEDAMLDEVVEWDGDAH